MPTQTFVTPSQLAERVGVHPSTIRRWVAEGKVPAIHTLGGHLRIARDAAEHLADRTTVAVGSRSLETEPMGP